ncbi:Glutaredoxin 3 [Microcystis aeruginosa NIES-2549]|uniref:Glutaredoxin 3 n=1 Tax=Microcystis aeruginosa NIES-2549 TaxID=1641812 RepID=A0A0F6U0V6_MICAE|nr:Glutaredoxin 3 [Microcystis aeruginosa NIES-2549]AOC50840.1 Glutaredoxin 3 [Microcystis aeruginosa NIES-2481]
MLGWKGVKYTEYKIDGDESARQAMAERSNGKRSVPQIFINRPLHNLIKSQYIGYNKTNSNSKKP